MSEVRPARKEDLESTTAMLNEHSTRLHGTADTTAAELLLYWDSPDVDFDSDILVADGANGSIVGYADIGLHGEHVWLDVRATDPEVLPELLAAIEARAEARKPGTNLIGFLSDQDEPLRAAYEQADYDLVRHSFRMQIDLEGEPVDPEWAEGYSVRSMEDGEVRKFYDLYNATFADTWLFHPDPFESWKHYMTEDAVFDPSLWFITEKDGEAGGIAISRAMETEEGVGWVRILGVLPDHRRRGLAQALLRHTFREFAERGFRAVGLGVDAENPTGAVRVYEKAGMRVERTNLLYEKLQG